MTSRDNKPLVLKDISITHDGMKLITFACDTIVEEYEDDMMALFRKNPSDVDKQICVDTAEVCTDDDMNVPMPEPGPVREDPPPDPMDKKEEDDDDLDEEENENDTTEDDDDFVDLPDINDNSLNDLNKDEL
ncbi:hypothetical protein FSP39_019762 [Pinctada imbricata]|uniref:DUF3456 domain-containing protein n=1 Tax=Pinctada imbricata TaxID=66713 RepID=A0AA88YAN9_PINIB|nr:hypothetical protein FSP39_019762 [Pinctada imbricata]